MSTLSLVFFSILALQTFSMAAPNENNVATPRNQITLDSMPKEVPDQRSESGNSKRQKRFYDYIDFKYPPFYPPSFPYPGQSHYSKRDESAHTGVYGENEAFSQIFRRLRDILTDAKQFAQPPPAPQTPPPVTHFTGFIPVLYIPPMGCSCFNPEHNNNRNNVGPVLTTPPAVTGNKLPLPSGETTTPSFDKRFPEIDDKRQNWGILINSTQSSIEDENDGNRPISFDPVIPDEAIDVEVPPVEHGSVQAGIPPPSTSLKTTPTPAGLNPSFSTSTPAAYPARRPQSREPSTCDTAIIACCVRSQIAPNCFARHGCSDTSIYGNPCDPQVVLNVLNKVEFYLKQKN